MRLTGTGTPTGCILAILDLALGCAASPGRTAFLEDLALVEARVAQRRYEEAASLAEVLEARALDDASLCPVLLARARAQAGLGQWGEALRTFGRVARVCELSPLVSARALFEMGCLLATQSPDPEEALFVFRRVVTRFPDEPAARRAVVWIRDIVGPRQGALAVVDEMRSLYRQAASGDVAPYLLFQAAEALREAEGAGDTVREDTRRDRLALYAVLLERHPDSRLADDAAVEAARICLDMGEPWTAATLLVGVLRRRETSWFIGSYETPIYAEAEKLLVEARQRLEEGR